MQIEFIASVSVSVSASAPAARQAAAADQLEQAFLEEMLKYCGPGAMQGDFSGGAGEDQFSSFLTREQASQLASRLDLGFGRMLAGQVQ